MLRWLKGCRHAYTTQFYPKPFYHNGKPYILVLCKQRCKHCGHTRPYRKEPWYGRDV